MSLPYHTLVGGSTQGIGRAVAEAGATVTLISRNETALREVATPLPTPTGHSSTYGQ